MRLKYYLALSGFIVFGAINATDVIITSDTQSQATIDLTATLLETDDIALLGFELTDSSNMPIISGKTLGYPSLGSSTGALGVNDTITLAHQPGQRATLLVQAPAGQATTILPSITLETIDESLTLSSVDSAIQLTSALSGSGILRSQGQGVINLQGPLSDFHGQIYVESGVLSSSNAASFDGFLHIAPNATAEFRGPLLSPMIVTLPEATLRLMPTTDMIVSSALSGGGSVEIDGTLSEVLLTGRNNLDGQILVNSGILGLSPHSAQGLIGVIPGAVVRFYAGATNEPGYYSSEGPIYFTGSIVGGGSLHKYGDDWLFLTQNTPLPTGGVSVYEGSLGLTDLSLNTDIGLASGTTLALDIQNDKTHTSFINGQGHIIKRGPGLLSLDSVQYGQLSVEEGTLVLNNIGLGSSHTGPINNQASLIAQITETTIFDKALTGSGTFEKTGLGTLGLSGQVRHQGPVTITEGGLVLTENSVLGPITTNAALEFDIATGSLEHHGQITGTGSVLKIGSGTLVLDSPVQNYSGGTTVSQGTLETYSPVSDGDYLINSSATLRYNMSAGDKTVTGVISGTGTFEKSGPDNLILNSANTFSGDFIIREFEVRQAQADTLNGNVRVTLNPSAVLTLNDFDLEVGSLAGYGQVQLGTATLTLGANNNTTDFYGQITGTGELHKTGSGTMRLHSAQNYTGITHILAGTLAQRTDNTLTAESPLVIDAGAIFDVAGYIGRARNVQGFGVLDIGSGTFNYAGGAAATITFNGDILGSSSAHLNKGGPGIWILSPSATLSYSGQTSINQGTLRYGIANALNPNNKLFVAFGATWDLNSFSSTIKELTGQGTVTLGDTGVLTIASSSAPTTFAGTITGGSATNPYSFIKSGSATLRLNGANTYSGQTQITGGQIVLGTDNALPTGTSLRLESGAIFETEDYQQTLSGLSGSGIVSIGYTTGSRNTLTLTNQSHNTFDGVVRGNANAVFNIADGSTLVLTPAADPTQYLGIVNVATGATLELENKFFGASAAFNSTGHIRSSGHVLISSEKTENDSVSIPLNVVISGTGTVAFSGTGHTTITAPQLYTGATTVSQGTVHYGVNNALPLASTVTINAGSTLDLKNYAGTVTALTGAGTLNFGAGAQFTVAHANQRIFSGVIDGDASTTFYKSGTGEMILDTGALSENLTNFQINSGSLTLKGEMAHSLSLTGTSLYVLDTSGHHTLSSLDRSPNNGVLESIILGNGTAMLWKGNLTLAGDAVLGRSDHGILSEINIQGGTLTVTDLAADYSFNQNVNFGSPKLNINAGSSWTVHVADLDSSLSTDLVAKGAGSLFKTGSGNLILTSSQEHTGLTVINSGTLTLNDAVTLTTSTLVNDAALVIAGTTPTGSRSFNFPITGSGSLTINDATAGSDKIAFPNHWDYRGLTTINSGRVENTGQVTLNGNAFVVSPSAHWRLLSPTLHLTGNSTLQGVVNIAGTTIIDTTGAGGSDLGNSSNIYQAQIAPNIVWAASDQNPNTRLLLEAGSTLQLDATARSMELAIDLSGSGSLNKTGDYRAVLKAPNVVNYTGATVVSAGTLVVDETFSTGSTASVTVAQGATFAMRSLKETAENRHYPNPSENPSILSKLPFISYSIAQYAGQEAPEPVPAAYSPTGGSSNYTQYSFPISGDGGIRIETPTVARNAVYLSGELTYTGQTTVAHDAFLYVDENFKATGDVYVDGVMQFYSPKRGGNDYHYLDNDFFSSPDATGALIEKYGEGNLVLSGDFSGFYGLINIQEGRLFFTDLPPNVIDIIGISNLIARGGSILTITAAEAEVVFGGRIVGETNARYRLVSDAGNAALRVTSLDLDGRIDLRQRFEPTRDPRITDPQNPEFAPPNGVAYDTLLQPQFIIDNLIVAPRSQFYFQFDQTYSGAAELGPDDPSLRSFARLNFINDSIAQYILQGDRDSGLFENHRYRLLEFDDTELNNQKVDEIMSLLRAPAMYVVEAQKVVNVERSEIYLDVIVTKRQTTNVLTEIQTTLAPVTIGIAQQIQNKATSLNNYERNANKVLENAADADDLVKQINYLIPNGNKKEKEQADPTATASTGSMAQQTVLNFQHNLLTKNFIKNNQSLNYSQKEFLSQAFKKRYDPIKDFNKRLAGHYEQQNFSWADVFDGIDIFGLSTSLESSYSHVETEDLPNQPGHKVSTWGSTLGVSQVLQDKYIVGMMVNYSARRVEFKPNTQNKTLLQHEKARNIGFFAAYQDMDVPYYWATFLSFGNHDYDGTRTWFHPRYDDSRTINEYIPTQAIQQHEGYSITANIELGYTVALSQEIALQPYIGAGLNRLYEPSYREQSQPLGINEPDALLYGNIMYPHLEKRHSRSIGLQAIQSFAIDNTAYQLSSRLSYVMTKNDGDERTFRYSYLYSPETVNEIVTPNERYHAFEAMLGFNIAYDYQWIISMNYTGSFGNRLTAHSIVGTVQYTFW